ncbi:inositol 2-dehydrogenase [Treponema sp. OMZ 840]|uniref:inositol 2-dehydrogenase n=1 Tax=Treponema sp. OMZ 840 TaxID=244313 RepID=UPI003D918017
MNKCLKIGIIGAGRIGKLHASNLARRISKAKPVALSDINKKEAQKLARLLDIPAVYDDYKEILADPAIEAVFICSSTDTHSEISMEAAKAGKHIFCEKPIDYDIHKIKSVLDIVKKKGVKYQVGFNQRFDPDYCRIKKAVSSGELGQLRIIKITSRDPAPPPIEYIKTSGGIYADMTIHDFDMMRYLCGSEITEVSAAGACLVDPAIGKAGDADTCVVTLRFANGSLGIIDNCRQSSYGYDQRIEVFGSKGQIIADNLKQNNTVLYNGSGIRQEKLLHFFLERYRDSYIREAEEFVDACLNNTDVFVGAYDGLQSVLVALAAQKSHNMGGMPVKVGEQ